MNEHLEDERYVSEIAPDVLHVLSRMRFFDLLDDRLCPSLGSNLIPCTHKFEKTVEILKISNMSSGDINDVLAVLRFKGACCDCEVLYNVAEESRLKAKYWKGKAQNRDFSS